MKAIQEKIYYFIIFFISSFFLLTTSGVFWDDWCLFHVDPSFRLDFLTMSGRPFFGHFFNFFFFLDPDGSIIFRILIFICFLIPIFILNRVLKKVEYLSKNSRILIVSLFSIFPVNPSKIAITMAQYSFCYLLFFLALLFTDIYLKKKKIIWRLFALILFYFSFTMDSLLVFYSLPFIYILYIDGIQTFHVKIYLSIKDIVIKYFDYFLLPFVYFIIKKIYFAPYGFYSDYNKVTLKGLFNSTIHLIGNTKNVIIPVLKKMIEIGRQYSILVAVLTVVSFILLHLILDRKKESPVRLITLFSMILVSFIILGISVFPYFVIGQLPDFNDWSSRHQVLMPLGGGLLFYYLIEFSFSLIQSFLSEKSILKTISDAKKLVFSFILGLFLAVNITSYFCYQKDWFKQLSLMEALKINDDVKNHTSFRIVDNLKELNANNRDYNYYEFTGMMKLVFGNEKRYGSTKEIYDNKLTIDIPYGQNSFREFISRPYEYIIFINPGSYKLTDINALKLFYSKYFNHQDYVNKISEIVKLHVVKL